jgi:hypothetical protein
MERDVSQSEQRLPSEQVPFQSAQIIVGALIFGTLVFAMIAFFAANVQGNAVDVIAYIAVGFAVMELIVSFVVPAVVARKGLQDLRQKGSEISATEFFGVYQTQLIIRGALLEGAAFFCCIAYMSTGIWWTLATALGLMVILALFFPTRGKFDDWVREQREQGAFDANGNG